jgi:hypothetical protein
VADSAGIGSGDGAQLTDWLHTQQSIAKILTTPIGARVMRRDFGSELFDLIDRKATQRSVLAIYAAAAVAIARWEPRFRMRRAAIADAGPDGRIQLELFGTYFPRGHLGDFTVAEDRTARVLIPGGGA